MKDKLFKASVFFLFLMYVVGLFAFHFSQHAQLFLSLTPLCLCLTALFLILFQQEKKTNFYVFCIFCFSFGYLIEVIGVNTGIPFGHYKYGNYLGLKIFETPLVIGINWLLLSLTIGSFTTFLIDHKIMRTLLAASIMVLVDFLIEPIAIYFNWWSWQNGAPEIYNYLGWFFASSIVFFVYYSLKFNKRNKIATEVLFILLLFFILNIIFIR